MKNLPLILLGLGFSGIMLMGCPLWEAAVEERFNDTETSSSATTTTIVVTPTNPTLVNGSATTFSASGATSPVSWSIDDESLGSIGSSTGVFTASESDTGAGIISGTDANGNTGSTTVIISYMTFDI